MSDLTKKLIMTVVLSNIYILNFGIRCVPLAGYELTTSLFNYLLFTIFATVLVLDLKIIADKYNINYNVVLSTKGIILLLFIINGVIMPGNYYLLLEIIIILIAVLISRKISQQLVDKTKEIHEKFWPINNALLVILLINVVVGVMENDYFIPIIFMTIVFINVVTFRCIGYSINNKGYDIEKELEKLDIKDTKNSESMIKRISSVLLQSLFTILIWEIVTNYGENNLFDKIDIKYVYLSCFSVLVYINFINFNTKLLKKSTAETIEILKKILNALAIYTLIVLVYLSIQKFIYEGLNESMLAIIILLCQYIIFKYIILFDYTRNVRFKINILFNIFMLMLVKFTTIITAFQYSRINYNTANIILLLTTFIIGVLFFIRNKDQKVNTKPYKIEHILNISFITLIISVLFSTLTYNIIMTIYDAFVSVEKIEHTIASAPNLYSIIFTSALVSISVASINIDNVILKKIIIMFKYISVMILIYKISESITLLQTIDFSKILDLVIIMVAYTSARGVSLNRIKFLSLVIFTIGYLVVTELIFYICGVLRIQLDSMSLDTYRILLALLIAAVLYAYIYMRNIKISKINKIFTKYRLLNSSMLVVLLFFGFVSGSVSSVTDGLRDKIMDILEDLNFDVNTEIYMNVTKDIDEELLFLKDTTSSEYEVGKGWIYGTDDLITSKNIEDFMTKEFSQYNDFFNSENINDWYIGENVSINYPTERFMLDNRLSLPTMYQDLKLENDVGITLYNDSRTVVDDHKVGEITFSSYVVDYKNEKVHTAIANDFEKDYNFSPEYTTIPSEIVSEIEDIKAEINVIYRIDDSTNDYTKISAISNYLSSSKYVTNFSNDEQENVIWEGQEDILKCIEKDSCNPGEIISLFSFISRGYGIPIRNTVGLAVQNKENTIQYVPEIDLLSRIPSFEIEVPSLGWIDGSHISLPLITKDNGGSNPGESENEGEIAEGIFKYENHGALNKNIFMREGFVKSYGDDITLETLECDSEMSHNKANNSLERIGLELIGNSQVITNVQRGNQIVYAPINNSSVWDGKTAMNLCSSGSEGILFNKYVGSNQYQEYVLVNDSIDWESKDTHNIIKSQFDLKYKNTEAEGLSGFYTPSNNIIAKLDDLAIIDEKIIKYYTNKYEQFMYINAVVDSHFTIGDNKNGIIEGINNRIITVDESTVIKASFSHMNGIFTRLASGYRIGENTKGLVKEEDREISIELLMPGESSNTWIDLPKSISKYTGENLETIDLGASKEIFVNDIIDLSEDVIDVFDNSFGIDEVDIKPHHYNIIGAENIFSQEGNKVTFISSGTLYIEYFVFNTLTGKFDTFEKEFVAEKGSVSFEIQKYGKVYESEVWDICTEFIKFYEPNEGENLITISQNSIKLIKSPAKSNIINDCNYQFGQGGTYTFRYEVESNVPNVNKVIEEIEINVEFIEIEFKINNLYAHDKNLTKLDGDTFVALNGNETNVCEILLYYDPVEAIKKSGGKMPDKKEFFEVTQLSSTTTNGCSHTFSSEGYSSLEYSESIDILGIRQSNKNYTLDVKIESNKINLELMDIPSYFYETETVDFKDFITRVYYNTDHNIDVSGILLTFEGGVSNNIAFPVVQVSDGEEYNITIKFDKEQTLFGDLKEEYKYDSTVEKALPDNVGFAGMQSQEIINGKAPDSISNSYNATSVLGTKLKFEFTIKSEPGQGNGHCSSSSPCSEDDIDGNVKNYFNSIQKNDNKELIISVKVIQELGDSNKTSREVNFQEEMTIIVYSEIPDISVRADASNAEKEPELWNEAKTNYNFIENDIYLNSNFGSIQDYVNPGFKCYILSTKVSCNDFNSKDYSSVGVGDHDLLIEYTDFKGAVHHLKISFKIIESKPTIEYNKGIESEVLYKEYEYNLCAFIVGLGKDYDGDTIEEAGKYEILINGESESVCDDNKPIVFTKAGIYTISFRVNDRNSSAEININKEVSSQQSKPEIVPPLPLGNKLEGSSDTLPLSLNKNFEQSDNVVKLSLSNNFEEKNYIQKNVITETSSNSSIIYEFYEGEINDICSFITAVDQGNYDVLYASNIEIINREDSALNQDIQCYDESGDVIKYSFNDVGEHELKYTFVDAVKNEEHYNIKITVHPIVELQNRFSDATLSGHGFIAYQFVGYDENGKKIFTDEVGKFDSEYNIDFKEDVIEYKLGEVYTSLYRQTDGYIELVDNYEYWGKVFTYQVNNDLVFEKKVSSSTCLLKFEEGYYFKTYNFQYIKQGGKARLVDECGEYDALEIKNFFEKKFPEGNPLNNIDLKEDQKYTFNGFISTNGFVIEGEPVVTNVFNVNKLVFNITIFGALFGFLAMIYYYLFLKKFKVNFLLEFSGEPKEIEPKIEYRYFKIYYSKVIERKYKEIISAYSKFFDKPRIERKQTYHEYVEKIFDEESVFNKEEFLIITNIFTRCRYYEPTVVRKYYLYFNNYYYNFFKDLELITKVKRDKKNIYKLRK